MSNPTEEYTRQELENTNVSDPHEKDLRDIAREVCGKGSWVSVAKKSQLIQAILDGEPPESVHANSVSTVNRRSFHQDPNFSEEDLRAEFRKEVQAVASSLKSIILKAVRMELAPVINQIEQGEGVDLDESSAMDVLEEELFENAEDEEEMEMA